jgi:membrane-associated phospholipid phosphatase
MLKAITDFGDLGVLLPLAAAVALWFLARRSVAAFTWWLAAVALCAGGTALLKVYFFACHGPYALTSPSGHSSFSALIYGALAVIVAAAVSADWQRFVIIAAAAGLVAAIAASRHSFAAHGPLEIVCGLAVGLVSLGVFVRGYSYARPAASLRPLLVAVVVLVVALHGHELRAEEFLQAVSRYLHVGSIACT